MCMKNKIIYHAECALSCVHSDCSVRVCVCVLLTIRGSSWSASAFTFISHKQQDEGNERKLREKAVRPLQVGKKTFVFVCASVCAVCVSVCVFVCLYMCILTFVYVRLN